MPVLNEVALSPSILDQLNEQQQRRRLSNKFEPVFRVIHERNVEWYL